MIMPYVRRSFHASECAVSNALAPELGLCDCAPPELLWKPFPMAETYRRVMQDAFDGDEDRLEAFNRLYHKQWPEKE